jgi:zona occludens toxin (predicted ATPase)
MLLILAALRAGRRVYTNIDGMDNAHNREVIRLMCGLLPDELDEMLIYMANPWEKLKADKPQAVAFWEFVANGSLIVLDEVHKLWSSRSYASDSNKAMSDWCSTHRHNVCDVVLITQSLDKIDAHVRSLIEWTHRYKKIGFMGSMVKNKFMEYIYSEDQERNCLSRKTHSYDPKIFKTYQSYAAKDMKEQKIGKAPNLFKHPVFFAIPVVLLGAIYMLSRSSLGTGDVFGTKKAMAAGMESIQKGKSPGAQAKENIDKSETGYYQDGKWIDTGKPVPVEGGASGGSASAAAVAVPLGPGSWSKDGNEWTLTAADGRIVGYVKYVCR